MGAAARMSLSGGDMKTLICAATVCLSLAASRPGAQEASSCPVRIKSMDLSPLAGESVTNTNKYATVRRKLSFRYENVSARDVASISLRIKGRLLTSGPAGPSVLDTSKPILVEGPMKAGKSGKKSVTVTTLPDQPARIGLTEVKFADG